MRKVPVWRITLGGVLIAFGILLPQFFHIFGPAVGKMLLPMHLCILVGGTVLGRSLGGWIGVLTPVISSMMTDIPGVPNAATVLYAVGTGLPGIFSAGSGATHGGCLAEGLSAL